MRFPEPISTSSAILIACQAEAKWSKVFQCSSLIFVPRWKLITFLFWKLEIAKSFYHLTWCVNIPKRESVQCQGSLDSWTEWNWRMKAYFRFYKIAHLRYIRLLLFCDIKWSSFLFIFRCNPSHFLSDESLEGHLNSWVVSDSALNIHMLRHALGCEFDLQ